MIFWNRPRKILRNMMWTGPSPSSTRIKRVNTQELYKDFEALYFFTLEVGKIVDDTIDEPFYKDMDAFVTAMRDCTPSKYTTTNRIGATEIVTTYGDYGMYQSSEVPKI